MMSYLVFVPIIISFLISLAVLPRWIKKCKKVGLLWEDMNKRGHPKNVASSGGVVVIMSFVLGVLVYIAIRTFFLKNLEGITSEIFALLCVILILSIVGLSDDLFGWKMGGLSARVRIFLALIAAIPLVVINAGVHEVNLPFVGLVDLGLIYPLFIIPLGIVGASTTYNFLAGFNGLEAGQGIIILGFLSFVAYVTGSSWLSIIGLCMVGALVGFYFYNKIPAKVFPGDILTYGVGALIACMAILGNFEKIAVFIFIPYIIEVVLKLRGKLKIQSFGLPQKDGSLKLPYKKVYGLTHLSIFILSKFKKKVYERDVVYLIHIFQIMIIVLGFLIFRKSIF